MGVRPFLAPGIDARPVVLDKCRHRTQRAFFVSGKNRDAAAAIVGQQNIHASMIHPDVTGAGAAGQLPIEQGQFSSLRVNSKGAHEAAVLVPALADRVKTPPVWSEREKRRGGHLGNLADGTESSRRQVQPKSANVPVPGTDEDQLRLIGDAQMI